MLSAVESFGPVSGPSAAHLYAHHHHPHHNPYAIAAAAAAAGSAAAAAAAAVIPPPPLPQTPLTPTTPTHSTQHQIFQSHQHHLLTPHQQHQQQQQQLHQHHLGYFLPPPPSVNLALLSPPPTSPSSCSTPGNSNSSHSNNIILPTTALVLTPKCSPLQLADYQQHQHHQQHQQHQQQQLAIQHPLPSPSHSPVERSPRRSSFKVLNSHQDDSEVMSSAEFARPHPKQPRYNNGASQINNSHSIPMNQRSPSNNPKSLSTANAAKGCSANQEKQLNVSNNGMLKTGHASRTPPSKYSTSDQSAPVNLVTSHHNSHHSSNHMISSIQTRLSTTPPDNSCSSSSGSSVDVENDGSMSPLGTSLPPRKGHVESNESTLFGGSGSGPVPKISYDTTAAAAAVAAAAYQFNFPHLYASRAALYGASALFTGHHPPLPPPPGALRPHPSYLTGTVAGSPVSPHENSPASLSAAYMQAVQNIYHHPNMQMSQSSAPAGQVATLQHQKSVLSPPANSVLPSKPPGFAPGVGPVSTIIPTAPISAPGLSNGHATLSLATPNDLRQKNSAASPSAPVIANGGTYLNKKVNNTSADGQTFKVPSGKEGSLKHRILTRPSQQLVQQQQQQQQPEKPEVRSASMTASVVRANNATTNFTKGAYIELANGVLRRVEDMRTEDFIQCAERSLHHQLAESTVVKITTTPINNVVITFSYDKNRSKADVEVAPEHPFFVYGQGWASYQPELSHKLFALKCQRLQVGDICISLTTREPPPVIAPQNRQMNNYKLSQAIQNSPPSSHISSSESLRIAADTLSIQPQNLSRKLHPASLDDSVSTSAVGALTSRLGAVRTSGYTSLHGMPPMHLMSPHLQTHQAYSEMADLAAAAYVNNSQILRSGAPAQSHLATGGSTVDSIYQAHHQHLQQQHHQHQELIFHSTSSAQLLPGQTLAANTPMQLTRPPSNHNPQSYYESPPSSTDGDQHPNLCGNGSSSNDGGCGDNQDQPVDASLSRKRRWSAPETIYDDGSGDDDISRPAKIVSYANSHQAQATNLSANTLKNCR